jgi:hypothetical protein
MRKKREAESDKDRSNRLEKTAERRLQQASAEDAAMDAAVRRSIDQHGA